MAIQRPAPGTSSIGMQFIQAQVLSVNDKMALVRDQLTKESYVPRDVLPGKGGLPQPGESWLLTRQYGALNFCMKLGDAGLKVADIEGGISAADIRDYKASETVYHVAWNTLGAWGQAENTAVTLTVDDPGFSYYLDFRGGGDIEMDNDMRVDMRVRLGSASGTIQTIGAAFNQTGYNGQVRRAVLESAYCGPFIGAQTFYVTLAQIYIGTVTPFNFRRGQSGFVQARVIPT